MLVQRVRVDPARDTLSDVRMTGDTVTEISRPGERLPSITGEEVVDGRGGVLLPGFVDGHVHMAQWALARRRLDVGAATGARHLVDLLVASGATGDVRAQGFRGALWTDTPHKDLLESALPGVPVAVTSMDLHTVWLSPAMMSELGVDHPTGVFRDHEAIAMGSAIDARVGSDVLDGYICDGTVDLAARGVTEVLDFEFDDNITAWTRRFAAREPAVRVSASTWPTWLEQTLAAGHRTGDVAPDTGGGLRMGPLKIMADGSLNTRTACCHDAYPDSVDEEESHGLLLVDHEELVRLMTRAAAGHIASAVHAIGDRANTVVLDAFETVRDSAAAGLHPPVGGRVEHAQQVRPEDLDRFAELGVVASVQPQHAVTDRDVADTLWRGRRSRAYPYGSLHSHGARLQFGSDAPVSPPDPRSAIADAVFRTDDGRPSWTPAEAVPMDVALAAASGGRSGVSIGSPADLVVLAESPYVVSNADLRAVPVVLTVSGGRVTHRGH
ncbi:amidohydrolase [Rhodococcus sp. MEB064]|uniref:amidohydrolase n=1 Tax=Rhodococcus sp. MEB064 TaxID=1587522 RepID=UPI0005ACB66C|nr:amidohydrolase family protein [Rhodococcus sp. MEB064]KIQ18278.1 hypothetical protein RU01_07840 [Rhodococcus sp. MEB064]